MEKSEELYEKLISPIEEQMIETLSRIIRHPEDAADVLQEVQAYIWRKLGKIHRHPNPHAYILRLCVSRSYDALRRRYRRRQWESPLTEESPVKRSPGCPEDSLVNSETIAFIHQAVASLPGTQGRALLLRAMGNEPYQVIAQILGCSETTARSHVSKARARLCKILGELGIP